MRTSTAPRSAMSSAIWTLVLILLIAPRYLPAMEDNEQPLYLEADSAEISEAKAVSIYTGNVLVRQDDMQLRGDRVTVHHDSEYNPAIIRVTGTPATYRQRMEREAQDVEAEARHMEYDRTKDEITLIDQVVLSQGKDTFRSDRIVYHRAQTRVKAGTIAAGKERVKIRISPARR